MNDLELDREQAAKAFFLATHPIHPQPLDVIARSLGTTEVRVAEAVKAVGNHPVPVPGSRPDLIFAPPRRGVRARVATQQVLVGTRRLTQESEIAGRAGADGRPPPRRGLDPDVTGGGRARRAYSRRRTPCGRAPPRRRGAQGAGHRASHDDRRQPAPRPRPSRVRWGSSASSPRSSRRTRRTACGCSPRASSCHGRRRRK